MSKKNRRSLLRTARFESFEERLALSAQPIAALASNDESQQVQHFGDVAPIQHFSAPAIDPVKLEQFELPSLSHMGQPDFSLAASPVTQVDVEGGDVNTMLNGAHQRTGVAHTYDTYGFEGAGQTVVVIDSGVDYLHTAFGAGFGEGHRIVGGYDFAEDDADPYDDGPAGFHGTHVTGIVASDHASARGVASGADIVSLRVFNDAGDGYFHWVEDALQWVHDNRNAFEHEITTVNLSIGTDWNSDSLPFWANLENEFAQLEADGIFIAVAAGNAFADYNETGLSYPAVSPYVVPVSSVDSNGLMSSFSQRHDRVLAAPGSSITSTVPDHTFGADGNHNDFGGASGTSMASPYVAGASMLVREAMEFAGIQNITQDSIYDHFRNTADVFFDSATSANYHRINVQAAIDALMPEDDYGSTVELAHNLGSVGDDSTFNGAIAQLNDADFFTFTAAATGELTLTAAETHSFDATWQLVGGDAVTADSFAMNVVGGQSYTFSLTTNDGIGRYAVSADLAAGATDWGQIESAQHDDVALSSSQTLFLMEASRTGQLTVEAFFAHASGNVDLELVNANNVVVASSNSTTDNERIDVTVNQGDAFTLRANGVNGDVDFRLTNLVSISGNQVVVNGTAGDDAFTFSASDNTASVNGVSYNVGGATTFTFNGGAGANSITAIGQNATLTANVGSLSMTDSGYTLSANSVATIDVTSTGGVATLNGSAGDDSFLASPTVATLSGDAYGLTARGFSQVNANGGGGNDVAVLNDSAGNDWFYGRSAYSYMMGNGYLNQAIGFDRVDANATTGQDAAKLFDTAGDEQFWGRENYSYMTGAGFLNVANQFDTVDGYSSGGNDIARVFDTSGNDLFVGRTNYSYMYSDSVTNTAYGFQDVVGYSVNGGSDQAMLFDSNGDDMFVGRETYSYLSGDNFSNTAMGFSNVTGYSSGGNDSAYLYDSAGVDTFVALPQRASLSGSGFSNTVYSFGRVEAYSSGGNDVAQLIDSGGDDAFTGRVAYSYMEGAGYLNVAHNFSNVDALGINGGNDTAQLWDSSGDDYFYGRSGYSYIMGTGFLNTAWGFDRVDAFASTGNDRAKLFDTTGDETFYGRPTYAFVQGATFLNIANNFDQVDAYSSGGQDHAHLTDSAGNDLFYGREHYSYMMGSGYVNVVYGYDRVSARSIYGGNDQANLFGSAGADSLSRTNLTIGLSGGQFDNRAEGFGTTRAYGQGGADQAVFEDLGSGDSIYGRDNHATLTDSEDDLLTIYDFEDVDAYSDPGGSPDTDIESVDYVFEQLGDWS